MGSFFFQTGDTSGKGRAIFRVQLSGQLKLPLKAYETGIILSLPFLSKTACAYQS